MSFRTLLVLVSTLSLLALSACKDKGGDDSGAATSAPTATLPA